MMMLMMMQDDVDDDDVGLASPKIAPPGLASPGVEIFGLASPASSSSTSSCIIIHQDICDPRASHIRGSKFH